MAYSTYEGEHVLGTNFLKYISDEKYLSRDIFIDPLDKQKVAENIKQAKDLLFLPTTVKQYYDKDLLVIGVLESGEKAAVQLINVPHYFEIFPMKLIESDEDIEIPQVLTRSNLKSIDNADFQEFYDEVEKLRYGDSQGVARIMYIKRKIYRLGQKEFIGARLYFNTGKLRRTCLMKTYANPTFFITANYSNYEHHAFILSEKYSGTWMRLTNYNLLSHAAKLTPPTKLKYNFQLNFDDYQNVIDTAQYAEAGHNIIATLDIETCEVKETEEEIISNDLIQDHNKIFNVRLSIADTAKPNMELLSIGLFRPACNETIRLDSHGFNIMCKSQKELLICLSHVLGRIQPDFIVTYSGNGFDIPIILLQARLEGVFDEFYCNSSILSSDTLNPRYGNNTYFSQQYKCYVKESKSREEGGGKKFYTNWGEIHTTAKVSGIYTTSEINAQKPLKEMKIENDRVEQFHYWSPPGSISIDLLLVSKQMFKKETSYSLSSILKKKGINEGKHDLPYAEIWRRWRASVTYSQNPTPEQRKELTEIDVYCAQDCRCTYLLFCAYMYLPQKRAMCKYTSLPLFTVIYQADGVKVVAGVTRLCAKEGYSFIDTYVRKDFLGNCSHLRYHRNPPSAHNTGALVNIYYRGKIHFDGTDITAPVDAIDAQSLYPSIMIFMMLSMDCISFTRPKNPKLYREIDVSDVDPVILNYYGIKNKTIWILYLNSDKSNQGIIPKYLESLFSDRIVVKNKIAKLLTEAEVIYENFVIEHPKEEFYAEHGLADSIASVKEYEKYIKKNIDQRYHQLLQLVKTYDAEQLAIKIVMNTVYGCTGFSSSPLYCFLIAYLTTKTGREIITKANSIVESLGCVPRYNDTDSVYFTHPFDKFKDIIANRNSEKYDKKMVHRSMKLSFTRSQLLSWYTDKYYKLHPEVKRPKTTSYADLVELTKNEKFHNSVLNIPEKGFGDIVNDELAKYLGSNRVRFVREETCYPHVILMKKKYFGLKHEFSYQQNMVLDKLIIKGISYVTRNSTGFMKTFLSNIMLDILKSPAIEIEDIVFEKMKSMYYENYDSANYCKVFTYKPHVKNVIVNEFVKRMKKLNPINPELYKIPLPLDTMRLVYVKPRSYVRLNGSLKKYSKHELYEYIDVVKERELVIDKEFYLKSLYAPCSQLLTYKKFDFVNQEDDVVTIKSRIQKQYVEPHFEKFINDQQHIMDLNFSKQRTIERVKGVLTHVFKYYDDVYPEISDLLKIISKRSINSAYDYLIKNVTKSAERKLNTKIGDIGFHKLSQQEQVGYTNEQLDDIYKNHFPLYRNFVDEIGEKMESTLISIIVDADDEEPNFIGLELFTEQELEILVELRHLIVVYIVSYRYNLRKLAYSII